MTDITASSLRELHYSTTAAAVVDELAALDLFLPDMPDALERHAALLERLPPLLDLRGRALVHAGEYERFLTLAEADPSALEDRVDTGNALAILSHAGEIAMLLVLPNSPEDAFAQDMLAKERAWQYGAGGTGRHDVTLMNRALRAITRAGDPLRLDGGRAPLGMEIVTRRFRGEILPERGVAGGTGPGVFHLEDAHALEAFFRRPPHLGELLDEVQRLLGAIEAWSEPEEPGPFWYAARRGALILAYARLCRIGLWPARSSHDLVAKRNAERLVSDRIGDPDSMRALFEIALDVGRQIARQGPPFVMVPASVEL